MTSNMADSFWTKCEWHHVRNLNTRSDVYFLSTKRREEKLKPKYQSHHAIINLIPTPTLLMIISIRSSQQGQLIYVIYIYKLLILQGFKHRNWMSDTVVLRVSFLSCRVIPAGEHFSQIFNETTWQLDVSEFLSMRRKLALLQWNV